jgi:hypothetical protein
LFVGARFCGPVALRPRYHLTYPSFRRRPLNNPGKLGLVNCRPTASTGLLLLAASVCQMYWLSGGFPPFVSVSHLASPFPLFLHSFLWLAGDASCLGWSTSITGPILSNTVHMSLYNRLLVLKGFIFTRLLHTLRDYLT